MNNPKITDQELESLKACQTEADWSKACAAIKDARGGGPNAYPPDWWKRVKLSGLMDRIFARWGSDSDLKMELF